MFLQNEHQVWCRDELTKRKYIEDTGYFLKQCNTPNTKLYNFLHQTQSNSPQCVICHNTNINELEHGNVSLKHDVFYTFVECIRDFERRGSFSPKEKRIQDTEILKTFQSQLKPGWICKQYNGLVCVGENIFNGPLFHSIEFEKRKKQIVSNQLAKFIMCTNCINIIVEYLSNIQPANLRNELPFHSHSRTRKFPKHEK